MKVPKLVDCAVLWVESTHKVSGCIRVKKMNELRSTSKQRHVMSFANTVDRPLGHSYLIPWFSIQSQAHFEESVGRSNKKIITNYHFIF